MKILLTGANGQLGSALAKRLTELGEVKATTRAELDLSKPQELSAQWQTLTNGWMPDVVVNAAAYTAVDKAQTEIEQARAVNALSVGELARLVAQTRSLDGVFTPSSKTPLLIHFSTDYVFGGQGTHAWRESDATGPLSVYGQTKLEGEQLIAQQGIKHLIFRTSWVVGAHGGNFLKTMLRLAAERDSLNVVADQVGVPTSVNWLCEVTVQTIRTMQLANQDDTRWGVYHVAAAGETNWCDYARYVIGGAIKRGQALRVQPDQVQPITTAQYPLPAPRPLNSRLNTNKLTEVFGLKAPDWRVGVDEILDELLARNNA